MVSSENNKKSYIEREVRHEIYLKKKILDVNLPRKLKLRDSYAFALL
jgi:hypothetical protein